MEISEKFAELLSEIEKQEDQIEEIARQLEESGSLDEAMESYLESTRAQLRQRKLELISEFQPKSEPLKFEQADGEVSPKAKERPNTPSSFSNRTNKYPLYSVQEIEAEKLPPMQKSTSEKMPPIVSNKPISNRPMSNVFTFPDNMNKFSSNKNLDLSSSGASLSEMKSEDEEEEEKKLMKEYLECREIMNTAHETMLLIKERLLELKEMEIENKMSIFEKSINNKRGEYDGWNEGCGEEKPPKLPPKSKSRNPSDITDSMQKIREQMDILCAKPLETINLYLKSYSRPEDFTNFYNDFDYQDINEYF